jgi:hypothetical protein
LITVSIPRLALGPAIRSQVLELALRSRARPTLPRPPHLIPTCLTIRIRPLVGDETAGVMPLIWGEMGRGIFLSKGLDRANHVETVQQISVFATDICARNAPGNTVKVHSIDEFSCRITTIEGVVADRWHVDAGDTRASEATSRFRGFQRSCSSQWRKTATSSASAAGGGTGMVARRATRGLKPNCLRNALLKCAALTKPY